MFSQQKDPRFMPNNFTNLSAIVKLASNVKFEKVEPWGSKKKPNELDKDGLEDPEVYFTFSVSCDVEQEERVERVRQEWKRRGGNMLEVSGVRIALFGDGPGHGSF